MIYTDVVISNLALTLLGENTIISFDDDNKRARLCQRIYEVSRDQLLLQFDWGFARKFRQINEVVVPDGELPVGKHAFGIPPDMVIARAIAPLSGRSVWSILGPYLIADTPDKLGLYYTSSDEAMSHYTPHFAQLLALSMAVRLSPAITQDKELTSSLFQQYKLDQTEAWEADANQSNEYRQPDERPENDTFVNPDLVEFLNYNG